jgi:heterodisulfide reductase subunit A
MLLLTKLHGKRQKTIDILGPSRLFCQGLYRNSIDLPERGITVVNSRVPPGLRSPRAGLNSAACKSYFGGVGSNVCREPFFKDSNIPMVSGVSEDMAENIKGSVLVVGGGIAGMQSALDLADSGYYVYLLEKSPAIGGVMAQLDKTFPTNDCAM